MESILLEDNQHWNNLNAYDHFVSREILPKARPLNIPCQSNSDRRNPITPELKF